MIQEADKLEKLEKFAIREMDHLAGIFMIKDDVGGYVMYDRYHLTPVPGRRTWQVVKFDQIIGEFETKRLAGAWCIADYYRQYKLEHELFFFNSEYMKVCTKIDQARAGLSRDPERRDMQIARIMRDKDYKRHLENALDKLVSSAKYIQLRGFSNETERSIAQPTRTKRRQGF